MGIPLALLQLQCRVMRMAHIQIFSGEGIMLNKCESCGQHSSQTAYELTTQHELCPPCYGDLVKQLATLEQKRSSRPEFEPTAAS